MMPRLVTLPNDPGLKPDEGTIRSEPGKMLSDVAFVLMTPLEMSRIEPLTARATTPVQSRLPPAICRPPLTTEIVPPPVGWSRPPASK